MLVDLISIASPFAVLGSMYVMVHDEMQIPDKRNRYINKLHNPTLLSTYLKSIKSGLKISDALLGEKLFSVQGFFFCVFLSMCYTVVAGFLAWGDGASQIGNTKLLPEWPIFYRRIYLLLLILLGLYTFAATRRFKGYAESLMQWFKSKYDISVNSIAAYFLTGTLILLPILPIITLVKSGTGTASAIGAIIGATLIIGPITFSVSGAACVIITILLLSVAVLFGSTYGLIFGPIAAAITVFGFIAGTHTGVLRKIAGVSGVKSIGIVLAFLGLCFLSIHYIATYGTLNSHFLGLLLFWIILPLINGMLDWISWGLSRYFINQITIDNGLSFIPRILIHGFIDIVAAIMMMILLTVFVCGGIEWFNLTNEVIGKPPPFKLENVLEIALNSPFEGVGIWISFMVLSTLIPTVLHLLALTIGILTTKAPWAIRSKVINNMKENDHLVHFNYPALYFASHIPVAMLMLYLIISGVTDAYSLTMADMSIGLHQIALWTIDKVPTIYQTLQL